MTTDQMSSNPELASLRSEICSEIAGAFTRLEDQIQGLRKENHAFQSKICSLEASNQQVLREVQLLRWASQSQVGSRGRGARSLAAATSGVPPLWATKRAAQPHTCAQQAMGGLRFGPGPVCEATEDEDRQAELKQRAKRLSSSMDAKGAPQGPPSRSASVLNGTTTLARLAKKFLMDISTPMDPDGLYRMRWDLVVLLLLIYVCITSPVIVCFNVSLSSRHVLWWFEVIVMCLFMLDVFFNFNTAYYDSQDKLVRSRWRIAVNYATSWMLIDVAAIIPFELFIGLSDISNIQIIKGLRFARLTRVTRVLRVIKLLRILKVFKMSTLAKQLQQLTGGSAVGRFLTVVGGCCLLLHLMACSYFYAAQLHQEEQVLNRIDSSGVAWADMSESEQETVQRESWETTWVGFGGLEDASGAHRYITSLYWSIYTLTTVGYGDIAPQNIGEKCVAMVAQIFGVSMFAYFMGSMSSVVAAVNSNDAVASKKITQMKEFMQKRRVPRHLTNKIDKFYTLAARHQTLDDHSILDGLSTPLKTELLLFLYRNTLEKVPFFQGQDPKLITSLVAKLRMEYYAEGDIVTAEGDYSEIMYFVVNGTLESRHYSETKENWLSQMQSISQFGHPNDGREKKGMFTRFTGSGYWRKIRGEQKSVMEFIYPNALDLGDDYELSSVLNPGDYVGEYSCLLQEPRSSTVVAVEFVEVYALTRDDLLDAYREWPDLYQEFMNLVTELKAMLAEDSLGTLEEGEDSGDDLPDETAVLLSDLHSKEPPAGEASTHSRHPSAGGSQGADSAETSGSQIKAGVNWGDVRGGSLELVCPPHRDAEQQPPAATSSATAKFKQRAKQVSQLQKSGLAIAAASNNPVIELLKNGHEMKSLNIRREASRKVLKSAQSRASAERASADKEMLLPGVAPSPSRREDRSTIH